MNRLSKRVIVGMLLVLPFGLYGMDRELPVLSTAYSEGIFKGVDLGDARTTIRFWLDSFGIPNKICKAGEVQFLDDPASWRSAAHANSFTVAILYVTDFLSLEPDGLLDPCFVFQNSGEVGSELLLVTHRDEDVNSLADLAGEDLLLIEDSYRDIARMWVDSLLAKEELPVTGTFFSAILEKEKANEVILPILYSRQGAAVVTRVGFEMMKELNPKLGNSLVILARSPAYVSTIICLRRGCDPDLGASLRAVLSRLNEDVVGRQVLMSLRIDGFQPYEPGCITSVRSLYNQYGPRRKSVELQSKRITRVP